MACPNFWAILKPSPVEPVLGYETPPVASITESQGISLLFLRITPIILFSFIIISITDELNSISTLFFFKYSYIFI